MDRFSALKAFTHVVGVGNFTRAADSLNMPNAMLSKTVRQLEAYLGVSLLQRTTRCITAAPGGREHYEKARCLLEDLGKIDAPFNTAHDKPKGHLRIAIGGSTTCDVLIPLLTDFMTSWPDIRINLQVADKPAGLISDNTDCAICGGPVDGSTLIVHKIGETTLVTCAAPDYPQCCGTPASPDELHHDHQFISYLSPTSSRAFPSRFARHGVGTELKTEPHLGINEGSVHIAAGKAGLGIVQAFTYSPKPALASDESVGILVAWRPAPYPFHVVYTRRRHVPPRPHVFIEQLAAVFPATVQG